MYLISQSEVENIAFTTPPAAGTIKDGTIATADNEILDMVGQSIYDGMQSKVPEDMTLLEDKVKPYMAFSVKVIALNTQLSDGGLTPDEAYSLQQSIKSALFNKRFYHTLLVNYLAKNYGISRKIISGFIIH
jgi:hypothetical protein